MTADSNKTIVVRYFALLREQRGCDEETVETAAANAQDLFNELQALYGLGLNPSSMKVVVNEEFCEWTQPIQSGDEVAFVPPVAGG